MKKILIGLSALLCLTAIIVIPSFANDSKDEIFKELKDNLQNVQNTNEKDISIIQVGDTVVTNKEFNKFKVYMEANKKLNNADTNLSDEYLWQQYIKDILLFEEAKANKQIVSLEKAKEYSLQMKNILDQAKPEAKAFQQKIIEATGLDEDTYWLSYAPEQYQEKLSIDNLIQSKIQDGTFTNSNDPEVFSKEMDQYISDLKSKIKIKVLSNDFNINNL